MNLRSSKNSTISNAKIVWKEGKFVLQKWPVAHPQGDLGKTYLQEQGPEGCFAFLFSKNKLEVQN